MRTHLRGSSEAVAPVTESRREGLARSTFFHARLRTANVDRKASRSNFGKRPDSDDPVRASYQAPQHFFHFLPLPHGQGSLRPILDLGE